MGVLIGILVVASAAWADGEEKSREPEKAAAEQALPKWFASGSLGATLGGLNSRVFVVNAGFDGGRLGAWTNHVLKAGINYGNVIYSGNKPVLNVNNILANYRFEGFFMKDKKPYFWVRPAWMSDQFQGFWQQYSVDLGPGYSFFGTAPYVLKIEAGYMFLDTNWVEKKDIDPDPNKEDLHLWEPTHNGIIRLIASTPIQTWGLFSEEAYFLMNFMNEDDYRVGSATALTFKLTSRLSFQTAFKVLYTNTPPSVKNLDETGATRTDATTGTPILKKAERTDYTWSNSLVVSFF
jgi:hypothetical protein